MKLKFQFFSLLILSGNFLFAQKPVISDVKVLEAGLCENQGMTGTCWSFSGMSFFQAELARMGKAKGLNLSEMFVVRNMYPLKAENYVRMHGKANFGEGGEFTDDLLSLRKFGLVPQDVFDGGRGAKGYNHSVMVKRLDSLVKKVGAGEGVIDLSWRNEFQKILAAGMGEVPTSFSYEGKTYNPQSFAKMLGLNADDYVFISSYTHHPYYSKFVLEVPDNWNWEQVYNVPMETLVEISRNAINKGYTVAWGADISNPGFDVKGRLALAKDGKSDQELAVSAELRQQLFDNYDVQDDHAMHIIGLAKDENGKSYFKVKNSWGKGVSAGEYFYASDNYIMLNTTGIMVHKKALPKAVAKQLGIK